MYVILGLQRMDAVQPGQRLHGGHTGQRLVHVHRAQQRLVKTGLVFVRGDQQPVLVLVSCGRLWVIGLGIGEAVRKLLLRETVELSLGVLESARP